MYNCRVIYQAPWIFIARWPKKAKIKNVFTFTASNVLSTRSPFIREFTSVPLCLRKRTQTLQRSTPRLAVTVSLLRRRAERLSAHYTVGYSVLRASRCPYLMKLRNSSLSASQSGLIRHLIKSMASIKTSTPSGTASRLRAPKLQH